MKAWANESFMIATVETVRYGVETEAGCWDEAEHEVLDLDEATTVVTVDEASLDAHLPLVTRRLTQAGIRLGHLLNRAVGGDWLTRQRAACRQSVTAGVEAQRA